MIKSHKARSMEDLIMWQPDLYLHTHPKMVSYLLNIFLISFTLHSIHYHVVQVHCMLGMRSDRLYDYPATDTSLFGSAIWLAGVQLYLYGGRWELKCWKSIESVEPCILTGFIENEWKHIPLLFNWQLYHRLLDTVYACL